MELAALMEKTGFRGIRIASWNFGIARHQRNLLKWGRGAKHLRPAWHPRNAKVLRQRVLHVLHALLYFGDGIGSLGDRVIVLDLDDARELD